MPTGTPSGATRPTRSRTWRGTPTPIVSARHDLVRAGADEPRGELRHAARVDGALEGAAERDADRDGRADAVRGRALEDPLARPPGPPRRTRARCGG